MNPEGAKTSGHSFDPTQCLLGLLTEFPEFLWSKVGQIVSLGIAPEIFDRVELWRISRQAFHPHSALRARQIFGGGLRAVCWQVVPHDQKTPFDMALQMLQEPDDLLGLDGLLM